MKHSTFIQHQAQYLLCTLAMLVTFVGTAWGDTTIFSLTAPTDNSISKSVDSKADWSIEDGYATITGGSATLHNGKNSAVNLIESKVIKLNGSSGSYLKISLSQALQSGDIITITSSSATPNFCFTLNETKATTYSTDNSGTYTFSEEDGFNNSKILYVWNNGGNSFSSLTITRPSATTTHTVTYALNGGEGTAPTQDAVAEGGTFTVAGIGSVTKSGYTFSGWNDGTSDYAAGATYTMGTSDVTLTAQWTAIPTYTVTYDVNGGTSATPTQDALYEGGTFTVASAPERADYTFNGWSDGTNIYAAGSTYTMGAANVTLTAQWESTATAKTVTLDGNGKTQTVTSLTEPTAGQGVVLPMGYTSTKTVDCSSFAWNFADNVKNKGTYNGYFQEAYYEFSVPAGNVLWKEITGLTNGTYEVVLKVAASNAWWNTPTGSSLTSAFANSSSINIPVLTRTAVAKDEANTIVLNASVTDGTLSVGIKNLQASANWYLASIESVKLIESSNFLAWYDADGNYAGTAGDTYKPTQSTTLYAAWENHTVTTKTVGLADKSNNWWTYFSPNTTIKSGETYKFSFNNFGSTGQNFYNWVLVAGDKSGHNGDFTINEVNKYKEYVLLRADKYGWDDYYQAPTLTGDFDSYIAALESDYGAKVEMTVTFNGGLLCVNATTRANDSNGNPTGDTYYYSMTSKKIDADEVSVFLTTEKAYLTDYTPEKVATPTHTVYFNLNGGTGTAPTAITAAEGASVTMPSAPSDIDMFGQTFYAWSPNGSDKYTPGSTTYIMGASDVTMGAQYYITPTKSVNFDGNGKNIAATTLKEPISGQNIILPAAYSSATSITSNASWVFATDVKNNGTYGGITGQTYQEAYYYTPVGAGDVMTKTETGLSNGTYEVIMSVGASWTRNNGVSGGITGNNLTYAFAQDKEISIPVIDRTWITSGEQNIVAFTVEVTDGTLKYGLKNTATAGNWYIINIESLKKIDNSTFDGWYDAATDGNKVGDAGAEYSITTDKQTLYAHWKSTSGSTIVLEQRGETAGVADGTFTNSTCTSNVAFESVSSSYTGNISENSTVTPTTTTAYMTGGTQSITIGLNSTSASKIVIAGVSTGSSTRQLTSIYVNDELVDASTYTVDGTFPIKDDKAMGTVTISGLAIAQGSKVTFNFEKIRVGYLEVTPYDGEIKSKNTSIQSVTVHSMALTAGSDGKYTYYIGTGYEGSTIDMVVSPTDNNATIGGKTDAQTITMNIQEPGTTVTNTVKVTAEDGTTTKDYTITVIRVPLTKTSTNKFCVSTSMTYIEGMQCQTPDANGAIKATISTTYGYPGIPGIAKENYANSYYTAYGTTADATMPTYNENKIPTGGVYYRFDVNDKGYIEMGINLEKDKELRVVDKDGNAVSFSSKFMTSSVDEVVMAENKITEDAAGYIQFKVEKDQIYYVYSPDCKLGFMGFIYQDCSSDATASFKLGDADIAFTNSGYEIKNAEKAIGETYKVNITPATGATITGATNATATGNANEYTITVPEEGKSVSAVFTITAEDGEATQTYTIRITKKQDATSRFYLTMKSTSDEAISANGNVALDGTIAKVEGGTATLYNTSSTEATLISKDKYALLMNADNYIKIDLNGYNLQEGDVIDFTAATGTSSGQICFTTDATLATTNCTTSNSFTIGSGSDLIGKSTIYVWRTFSSAYINELEITTPDLCVYVNETTVYCNGGEGTQTNPKTYTYTVPASYTEATVPVSIVTSGTINDLFTSLVTPTRSNPTVKSFSITSTVGVVTTTKYYTITLNPDLSNCTLIAATATSTSTGNYDAIIEGNVVAATIPYNASIISDESETITLDLTIPEGAKIKWNNDNETTRMGIGLNPVAGSISNDQSFTITAEDGVSTATYKVVLTRGLQDNKIYLVTYEGQQLYLTTSNIPESPTDAYWAIKKNGTKELTINDVTATYYDIKNSIINNSKGNYITIHERGAISFTATTSIEGKSGRNVYVQKSTDGTTWTTCGKFATDGTSATTSVIYKLGEATQDYYIRLTGDGDNVYAIKLTFYTETQGKDVINLAYSAGTFEEGDTQPTVTAKDMDGNTINLSNVGLTLTYNSDDEHVATVASNGTITFDENANGSATIYAQTPETSNYYSASTSIVAKKLDGYTYDMAKVEDDTYGDLSNYKNNAPQVTTKNQQILLKDEDSNTLVTGTFGGWTLNENKYTVGEEEKIDSWNEIKGVGDFAPVDGFTKNSGGVNDARDEALKNEWRYGEEYYGAFHPAEKDAAGTVTTYPFTLPVRGTYMTFEPTQNGMLSIYILQNGAWGDAYGKYRRHAFFLTDQSGVSMADYTSLSTVVKNKVTSEYSCSLDAYGNATDDDPNNIGNWPEFQQYFSQKERLAIQAAWQSGVNGAEKMVVLDDGSFLVTQKACVKYTFYAIAGQTYYLFANKSKMGFCGMNFVPDASDNSQPTKELDLSENLKYDADAIANDADAKVNSVTNPMYKQITLDRTFTEGHWNTICIPFTMTAQEVIDNFGEGSELIILDNINITNGVGRLHFTYHEIQQIVAGYPYIIKPTKSTDGITVADKTIDPYTPLKLFTTTSGYTAKGVDGYCNPEKDGNTLGYSYRLKDGDIFVANDKMWVSKGSSYMKGYRAYMEAPEEVASHAKSVIFEYGYAWDEDGEATQIDMSEIDPEVLEGFGIVSNGVYNLNGQKVADSTTGLAKGVYIVNGKKIIIK